jgi:hypothetical protein
MKKKILSALTSGFALAILLPATSFAASAQTDVNGTVTYKGNPVKHAHVSVTCGSTTKNVQTDASGAYLAVFSAKKCPKGSTVTVNASKSGDGSGSNTGTVNPEDTDKLNVAIVNVSLPEFGLLTAGAATVAGGTAFAVVRRRQLSGHQA